MTAEVDVILPAGWFPLGPVPGALMAATAAARDGRAVATMVIRMQHCPGLADDREADAVFAAVPAKDAVGPTARALRWCRPETVAVLVACAAPDAPVTADDLASALDQTVVYAVDSTGSAIRSSSAEDAKDACRGRTRTV
jgi:hypothetical protein